MGLFCSYTEYQLSIRLQQAYNHISHPYYLFGKVQLFGPEYPFLNEYILSVIHTCLLATIVLSIASLLDYWVLYRWKKDTFIPFKKDRQQYKEDIKFDIKWAIINLIGQLWPLNLIKMGYPYFSKVQYQYSSSPLLILYLILHIIYDQFLTYWAHRFLHTPFMYRHFHSIHHRSKSITPFSAYAFHPLDAFLQAFPVFTSCYFLPIPLDIILAHGFITTLWAISIHDNVNMLPFKGILYAGSHTIHHYPWGLNYNYGKITSVCDRLYGSYCDPQGITGYGYEVRGKTKQYLNQVNKAYQKLVPDLGKEQVWKGPRRLIKSYQHLDSQQYKQK